MPVLQEIFGATERPAGCRIRVWQADDGHETTISIPPRAAPFWLLIAAGVLVVNLLLVFVTGLILFVAHKSVLFMTQIAPGDLPPPMHRFEVWLAFSWAALLTVGVWALATLLRPLFLRERLTITPDGVTRYYSVGRRRDCTVIPHSELRGFHLRRDPLGMNPSVLSLQWRGDALPIAEYVSEADREWLASVGNALLRAL